MDEHGPVLNPLGHDTIPERGSYEFHKPSSHLLERMVGRVFIVRKYYPDMPGLEVELVSVFLLGVLEESYDDTYNYEYGLIGGYCFYVFGMIDSKDLTSANHRPYRYRVVDERETYYPLEACTNEIRECAEKLYKQYQLTKIIET